MKSKLPVHALFIIVGAAASYEIFFDYVVETFLLYPTFKRINSPYSLSNYLY